MGYRPANCIYLARTGGSFLCECPARQRRGLWRKLFGRPQCIRAFNDVVECPDEVSAPRPAPPKAWTSGRK